MTQAPDGSVCVDEPLPVPPPDGTKRPPKWLQSTLAGSVFELLTRYAEGVPRPAERRIAVMNTCLQEFAPSPQAGGRDWKPFADHLVATLATLSEDQSHVLDKHVDLALRRFCGATDGVDVMLQREFGGRTAFIEILPGALLH
jgi:hypothetical protein